MQGRLLLLAATGFLSQPRLPDIPGIESFTGTVIHTAAWDDDHDLTGERVTAWPHLTSRRADRP